MEKTYNFRDLLNDTRQEVRDELEGLSVEEMEEYDLHELADGNVPCMHYDLLRYGAENLDLSAYEPDILAFDGTPTAVNCIAGRIYEDLLAEAEDERRKMIEEKTEENLEKAEV